jgi:hypothetical protein
MGIPLPMPVRRLGPVGLLMPIGCLGSLGYELPGAMKSYRINQLMRRKLYHRRTKGPFERFFSIKQIYPDTSIVYSSMYQMDLLKWTLAENIGSGRSYSSVSLKFLPTSAEICILSPLAATRLH